MQYLVFHNEPHWRRAINKNQRRSPLFREWLSYKGSLTKKLKHHANGDFRVELLFQGFQKVSFSEQRSLRLSTRRWALVREVALWVKGSVWVYARTVIPLSTLKGKLGVLQNLGNRPLGEQLFANPTMQREAMMFATVTSNHLPAALSQCKPLGGRRTLFKLNHKPLLVCEIFLDAIEKIASTI